MELTPKQKHGIRVLFYEKGVSVDTIASRTSLPKAEIEAILKEPDDLADFSLHHFSELTRKLHKQAVNIVGSIDADDLEGAPVSARATLLKTSLDTMQKMHDIHMIHKDKSEDFKLARLLAMGREEAREALIDRFKSLAHVLFGGMSERELVRLMKTMNGETVAEDADDGAFETADEPVVQKGKPTLSLVATGTEGGEKDVPHGNDGTGGSKTGRDSNSPQGIGAFRGIKKGEPS